MAESKAETKADIIVLGGGLAGCVAAWRAAKAGKRVVLIRRGQAGTAASSGAIDLAADHDSTPENPLPLTTDLETLVAREISRDPSHLFSRLTGGEGQPGQQAGQRAGRLLAVFSLARKLLEEMTGIPLAGDGKTLQVAVSHAGTVKHTALVQASMSIPDLDFIKRKRVGFCGVKGVPGWDGERAAAVFSHVMSSYEPPRVRGFNVELPEALGFNSNALGVASLFDDAGYFDRFIEKIRIGVGSNTYDVLFVPPLFGFKDAAGLARRAGEKLNNKVVETVSAVPSVPGMRLQTVLDRALREAGVSIVAADITGADAASGRVKAVAVRKNAESPEESFAGAVFVLATGKYLGGGLIREKRVRESLFGLPVFLDGREALSRQSEELFSREAAGPHPAFRAGVQTDPSMRPVDPEGKVIFSNLLACGNVLAGYDYLRGGTGLGAALITGYLAGEQIVSEGTGAGGRH